MRWSRHKAGPPPRSFLLPLRSRALPFVFFLPFFCLNFQFLINLRQQIHKFVDVAFLMVVAGLGVLLILAVLLALRKLYLYTALPVRRTNIIIILYYYVMEC